MKFHEGEIAILAAPAVPELRTYNGREVQVAVVGPFRHGSPAAAPWGLTPPAPGDADYIVSLDDFYYAFVRASWLRKRPGNWDDIEEATEGWNPTKQEAMA